MLVDALGLCPVIFEEKQCVMYTDAGKLSRRRRGEACLSNRTKPGICWNGSVQCIHTTSDERDHLSLVVMVFSDIANNKEGEEDVQLSLATTDCLHYVHGGTPSVFITNRSDAQPIDMVLRCSCVFTCVVSDFDIGNQLACQRNSVNVANVVSLLPY